MSDVTLTDAEWREFQSIPDQGHSHREWINHKIAAREKAVRAEEQMEAADARREQAEQIAQAIEESAPTPDDAYARESLGYLRSGLIAAARVARQSVEGGDPDA